MTKRYQKSNQEGIDQRRTDNTMAKRYQRGNQEGIDQRRTDNTMTKRHIVSPSLIYAFLITALISFGHCIVSPSLICAFLITPLVSYGHCIVSPSLICKDTKGVIVKKPQIKEGLTIQ
jgi:hypothetical protein